MSSSEATYEVRKTIFNYIKTLNSIECEEIYKIIRKNKEHYSENSNGVFFDLNLMSDDTIDKINEYIQFCMKNKSSDESRLKELEKIRIDNELTLC